MVFKRTNNALTNNKSIFLPHIQATNNKFNWPKELKTQPKFTFITSNTGMDFANQQEINKNNGKFYAHRVGRHFRDQDTLDRFGRNLKKFSIFMDKHGQTMRDRGTSATVLGKINTDNMVVSEEMHWARKT